MTDIAESTPMQAGRRVEGQGAEAWFEEARELLKLAGPLVLTQLSQMAILTTDVVMLGRLGKTALAGAALGNTIFFFTWLVGAGPTAAVAPMIAHILGANPRDRAGVRNAVRMAFWAMLIISVPLIGLLLFTRPILLLLGQSPELATGAGRFTAAICWGLPFSLGYQVLRNFSTALSRPRASLYVMASAIFFNAAGDYGLIFGHFGLPRLELVGSGISSACSLAFAFFAMAVVVSVMPALKKFRVFRRFHRPHWKQLSELYRLGMPIGLTMMFEAMLFNAATLIMGTFGTASVAAHQIALNVSSVTFMVPLGIGMAASVRVGLASGAGDGEALRRAGYTALLMGGSFMCIAAVAFWLLPADIAGLYLVHTAGNADVIALAIILLRVAGAFEVFDGLQVVGAMSLRGLKDAHMPMWIAGLSYWLVGFPICLWLAFDWHLKGLGIWIGLATGLFAAAVLMVGRFWYLSRAR